MSPFDQQQITYNSTSHYYGRLLVLLLHVSSQWRSPLVEFTILMRELAVTYGGVGKPLAVNMMQDPNRLGRAQLVCDNPHRH
jgi:hypothetical protein